MQKKKKHFHLPKNVHLALVESSVWLDNYLTVKRLLKCFSSTFLAHCESRSPNGDSKFIWLGFLAFHLLHHF